MHGSLAQYFTERHRAARKRLYGGSIIDAPPVDKTIRRPPEEEPYVRLKVVQAEPQQEPQKIVRLHDEPQIELVGDQPVKPFIIPPKPLIVGYPKIREITRLVADAFGVTALDIVSQRRIMKIVRPRQVAMYLCRHFTLRSLPEIGRQLGGRDHSTVLHGIRRAAYYRANNSDLDQKISALESQIRNWTGCSAEGGEG